MTEIPVTDGEILRLSPEEYREWGGIWDGAPDTDLIERFYRELRAGNRLTFAFFLDGACRGEASLVFATGDADYSGGGRLYLSRLIVQSEYRNRGIGTTLLRHAEAEADRLGYRAVTVGVNLENFDALRLYVREGFDRILRVDADGLGRYVKLLREW